MLTELERRATNHKPAVLKPPRPQAAFTDLDRRTIANLTIPRNVYDLQHRLRTDPHTPTRSERSVHRHLLELADRGLAVNLGEWTDMAKLAHRVEQHPAALTMPDDKAALFAARLSHPHRRWRVDGDVWMLTRAGLDQIDAPPPNAPGPMTPSQVQAAINHEWSRIVWDWQPGANIPLGQHLLLHEFQMWAGQVVPECERIWNVRPKLPVAGGASGWSDAFEITILDQENQKTLAPALVDPWYMTLSKVAFTDADTGTTADDGTHVPSYTGWARKSVAASLMSAAAAGSSNNSGGAITFAACTGSTSTIVAAGNTSALTVGILRKWFDVTSTVISTTQTPATFNTGAYVTTAD